MINSYTVGVSLELTGNAIPKLKSFNEISEKSAKLATALTKSIKGLNESLTRFNQIVPASVRHLTKFNERIVNFRDGVASSGDAFKNLNAAITKFDERISSAMAKMGAFTQQTRRFTKSATFKNMEAGGLGAVEGAAFASRGGSHLHGRFHLGEYFGISGSGVLAIGGAALGYESIKKYNEFSQASSQFQQFNFTPQQNAQALAFVNGINVAGTSKIDAMEMLRHSTQIMGSLPA
ncbi:MAG: hypothetical protein RLZZ69_3172, partial [Cyanobacteriota bacterium]